MSYFKYLYFVLFFLFQNTVLAECIKGDCVNGQGTFTSEEMLYSGDWKDGKAHGQGLYENKKSGLIYKGDWKNSKFDGSGTLTSIKGDEYVGEFKDGRYHGNGVLTYADGIVDEGVWDNGKLIKKIKIQKKNSDLDNLTTSDLGSLTLEDDNGLNQKKENLSSLLKIDLFGIKLGDQISNYKLINKQFEPNYSYYFYNSKHQFQGEEGILLKVHTIGGNGLQEGDNGDGYIHLLYNIKRKGYTEIMTMLSKHDHSFVEPVTPNKDFENYIVKFDPITKKVLAVMAKQKSTSKEDCEESNWKNTFEKFYINKMIEKNLFVLSEVTGMLRIFNKEPYSPNSTIEKNLVAGFGFTCVDQLFGKSRWMFLINLSDEPEYHDNLYSILLNQKNKTEKIDKENLKKSEKYKGM